MKLFPDHIRTVAVAAPAGRCDEASLALSLEWLRGQGLEVRVMPHVGKAGGAPYYLSASAEERLADLHEAFADEKVDLVICSRGGFGSAHLLELQEFQLLHRPELPVVGYSDITALHMGLLQTGGARPVTGPMAGKFAESMQSEYNRHFLALALGSDAYEIEPLPGTEMRFRGGGFSGMPLAANLTVLTSLAGTKYFPSFKGRIAVLEDVGEAVYRIDRMLTQLRMAGAFEGCCGVCFGTFSGAGDGLERLLEETLERLTLPGVLGFPFGHGGGLAALDMTRMMQIDRKCISIACNRP